MILVVQTNTVLSYKSELPPQEVAITQLVGPYPRRHPYPDAKGPKLLAMPPMPVYAKPI